MEKKRIERGLVQLSLYLVKMAYELPEEQGRSLSLWTCAELARTLRESGVVESISPQSVQRILASHKLKPWRVHYWLAESQSATRRGVSRASFGDLRSV